VPLETATYLHDLVVANPAHTDGLSQADSHMRLLKSTLQNTFPNFTSAALASTQAQIDAAVAATPFAVPTGAVMDFAMATAPTGWLACDGQAVSRTTYAALFAAVGTTWGVGDGSTTFNVPPLQNYFRRHRNVAGLAGAVGTLQNPSNLTHTHAVTGTTGTESANHTHTQQGAFLSGGATAATCTMPPPPLLGFKVAARSPEIFRVGLQRPAMKATITPTTPPSLGRLAQTA
jgi:microcystin-dependent protein